MVIILKAISIKEKLTFEILLQQILHFSILIRIVM